MFVFFEHFIFNEFPATTHTGYLTTAFHIIMVEYQVYMDHREENEKPHGDMVYFPQVKITTEHGRYPGE